MGREEREQRRVNSDISKAYMELLHSSHSSFPPISNVNRITNPELLGLSFVSFEIKFSFIFYICLYSQRSNYMTTLCC